MSAYEERLASDKARIRRRVVSVGGAVERAISIAVDALIRRDRAECYSVVLGDFPINRQIRDIDQRCHAFVARHLPSAGHLRFVSSVLRMSVALERIGDYAVTIAREAVQLSHNLPQTMIDDLVALRDQVCSVLRDALFAFGEKDADLARETRPRAQSIERNYGQMYQDLTREGAALPVQDTLALLSIFYRLERVSDQAKNLSEETLFELTGEKKTPRRTRIVFADLDGGTLAPLAEALARKAFPNKGNYSSAALAPCGQLSALLDAAVGDFPVDLSGAIPSKLPTDRASLERFDVIVALQSELTGKLQDVPYATIVLDWNLTAPTDASGLDLVSKQLAANIRDLLELLWGDEAQ